MSKTKEGKVEVKRIMKKFSIKRSPFMERVFSILILQSIKGNPAVDYKIFIFTIWNLLTIGLDMPALAMSLYDLTRTKRLSRDEVHDMMKDIHGWKLEQHHTELTRAIRGIESTGLNLAGFQMFVLKNKLALEPITQIFDKMFTKTLGKARWTALARKRQERWEGKFVDLYDVMADMKEETGFPDHVISLEQYREQIAKNIKYMAEVEEIKRARNNPKPDPSAEEKKEEVTKRRKKKKKKKD
eukprot:CAMPEP_0114433990 /NCGR_PEP_ID=MMETSP0103-20121206/12001_1 /TAXON_ID=37642 ORGANISM="Paraphysomonas imperforata, Strain PA2" /NCGR_SAMPLE_ID=MMETSP0103 /ASSEMBLY_ACC=CAM_ASM_000201 /LENGTH=241 /DNA_ID=CAMNT_0001603805 /DNA_START=216 /DNA_END=941 /DNA_ORIENTATION=-